MANPDPDQCPTKPSNPDASDASDPVNPSDPYAVELSPERYESDDLFGNENAQLLPPKEAQGLGIEEKEEPEVDLAKWTAFDNDLSKVGKACRFCLDDGNQDNMIAPCLCAGGSQWVHRSCLEQWQSTSLSAYQHCPNCLFQYRDDPDHNPSYRRAVWRFRGYLLLDFLGFFVLWQLIVFCIFGVLVGGGYKDEQGWNFWEVYAAAMVLFLFGLGVMGTCVGICYFLCFKDEERQDDGYGGRGGNCPLVVCANCGPHHRDCDCCVLCCSGNCDCGGGGLDGNCSGCRGNGAEALLILFIIFVVIGVFVLFYVGGTYMGRRYNRRSKKLLFLSSAKEDRVADLSKVSVGERDKLDQLHCRLI